jgi:DEAD/DEAH box helicase domain-containing protein
MTDPADIGHTLGDRSEDRAAPGSSGASGSGVQFFDPTLFVYDRIAGGIGLAARLYQAREELVRRARGLIEGCECSEGCPACVGPVVGLLDAQPSRSRKQIALALLADLRIASTH